MYVQSTCEKTSVVKPVGVSGFEDRGHASGLECTNIFKQGQKSTEHVHKIVCKHQVTDPHKPNLIVG